MTGASAPGSRSRWREAIAVDLVLVGVLVVLLPQTLDLSEQARRLPLWVIGAALLFLLLDLARLIRNRVRDQAGPAAGAAASDVPAADEAHPITATDVVEEEDLAAAEQEDQVPGPRFRSEALALFWLVAAGVGIYAVGYLVTVPLFMIAFFLFHRVTWKVWAPVTAAVSAIMYFGFHDYLGL